MLSPDMFRQYSSEVTNTVEENQSDFSLQKEKCIPSFHKPSSPGNNHQNNKDHELPMSSNEKSFFADKLPYDFSSVLGNFTKADTNLLLQRLLQKPSSLYQDFAQNPNLFNKAEMKNSKMATELETAVTNNVFKVNGFSQNNIDSPNHFEDRPQDLSLAGRKHQFSGKTGRKFSESEDEVASKKCKYGGHADQPLDLNRSGKSANKPLSSSIHTPTSSLGLYYHSIFPLKINKAITCVKETTDSKTDSIRCFDNHMSLPKSPRMPANL